MRVRIVLLSLFIIFIFISCNKAINKTSQTKSLPIALYIPSVPASENLEIATGPEEIIDREVKIGGEKTEEAKTEEAPGVEVDSAVDIYILGATLREDGRLEEAVNAYEQAVMMKPGFIGAYYNLGSIYTEMGLYDKAIDAYKKVIEISPENMEIYHNLGLTYLMKGEEGHAHEVYRNLRNRDPESAENLYESIIQNILANNDYNYIVQVAAFNNSNYAKEL